MLSHKCTRRINMETYSRRLFDLFQLEVRLHRIIQLQDRVIKRRIYNLEIDLHSVRRKNRSTTRTLPTVLSAAELSSFRLQVVWCLIFT